MTVYLRILMLHMVCVYVFVRVCGTCVSLCVCVRVRECAGPFTPADKYKGVFANKSAPITPNYNHSNEDKQCEL